MCPSVTLQAAVTAARELLVQSQPHLCILTQTVIWDEKPRVNYLTEQLFNKNTALFFALSLSDHSLHPACLCPFPTIRTLNFSAPLKNVAFTTMRQYMIRIRRQEKHRKVERDESVGNVTAVVRLPAPAAGAMSGTLRSPQSPHSPGDMYTGPQLWKSLPFGLSFNVVRKREAIFLVSDLCCLYFTQL